MSQAIISYNYLKESANEAKAVAKKLDTYADHLQNQIARKISGYSGDYTGNIQSAKSNINSKINDLRSKSTAYENYETDLTELVGICKFVDESVRSSVSKLTAAFKKSHGIKDNKVVNTINYYLTTIENRTAAGRWLSNHQDRGTSIEEYKRKKKKDWWNYEGGKQFVKGIFAGVIDIALAVSSVVGIICKIAAATAIGPWLVVVAIATAVAAGIAIGNAYVNYKNEKAAYETTKNGDPATGRRRSEVNTLQDYLRSSFVYGDDGEYYEYDERKHMIAGAVDGVGIVCETITFFDNILDIGKNLGKWKATGAFDDMKSAFKTGNFDDIKIGLRHVGVDFIDNLKKSFTTFGIKKGKDILEKIKAGNKVVKTYLNIVDDLIDKGVNVKTILLDIGVETILEKNINLGSFGVAPGSVEDMPNISVSGVVNIVKDPLSILDNLNDIRKKLSEVGSISSAIPALIIPVYHT